MKNTFVDLRTLIAYRLFPVKPSKCSFGFAVIGIVPVIQKVEQLCAQLIDNANTMKISFNTYVIHKYEKGKIK